MSEPDTEAIAIALRDFFRANDHGAAAVYLFGSVARGSAGARSDVDIAVLYAMDPPATIEGLGLRVEGELEKVLGREVQVIVLNRASPDLVHRVLRDGRLVFEHDRSRRVRFEVQARNQYFDMQPILERYRKPPAA